MTLPHISHIPTPFYLYDIQLLRQTLEAVNKETRKYPNYHVHYAIKANANPLILQEIRTAGMGIDCVSGGEIQTVLQAGFTGKEIVFAGVGKSDWEINLALDNNIFSFNVESIPELEVINQLAQLRNTNANVCLRINPDVSAHTHAHITTGLAENKFGIDMKDMHDVIRMAQNMQHIRFRGLHFHIGSQILDMADFISLAKRVNQLQDELEKKGIFFEVINVGGGLGIDYEQPDLNPIPNFTDFFATYHQHLQLRPGQELHFELGRALVAQCGTLIARTLYVKQGTQKKFVILDAGMTELIRPALYGARHLVENLSKSHSQASFETYDVVGPICESSDTFGKDLTLPHTERGDIIAIRSTGAYGETMASQYNLRPLPKAYTVDQLCPRT